MGLGDVLKRAREMVNQFRSSRDSESEQDQFVPPEETVEEQQSDQEPIEETRLPEDPAQGDEYREAQDAFTSNLEGPESPESSGPPEPSSPPPSSQDAPTEQAELPEDPGPPDGSPEYASSQLGGLDIPMEKLELPEEEPEGRQEYLEGIRDRRDAREEKKAPARQRRQEQARATSNARRGRLGLPPLEDDGPDGPEMPADEQPFTTGQNQPSLAEGGQVPHPAVSGTPGITMEQPRVVDEPQQPQLAEPQGQDAFGGGQGGFGDSAAELVRIGEQIVGLLEEIKEAVGESSAGTYGT